MFYFAIFAIAIAISLQLANANDTFGEELLDTALRLAHTKSNPENNNRGLGYQLYNNAVLTGSHPLYEGTTLLAKLSLEAPEDAAKDLETLSDSGHQHNSRPAILSGSLKGSLSVLEGNKKRRIEIKRDNHAESKDNEESKEDDWYTFECVFDGTATAWVRVGSHLVCHDGNAYSYQQQNPPIPLLPNKQYAFHAILTTNATTNTIHNSGQLTTNVPSLSVYWKKSSKRTSNTKMLHHAPNDYVNGENVRHPLDRGFQLLSSSDSEDDSIVLHPSLPTHEAQRQDLNERLARGWGHWLVPDLLSLTKLPEGIVVGLQICSSGAERDCVGSVVPDSKGTIKVDRHSTDRSYASFNLTFVSVESKSVSLNIETSATGSEKEELRCLMTITDCDACEGLVLTVEPRYAWFRPGIASKTSNTSLTFNTPGLKDISVRVLIDNDAKYPFPTTTFYPTNSLTIPLAGKGHKIGLVAGPSSSLHNESLFDIEENVRNMNIFDDLAMKEAFGPKHEVAQAIRAAVMWSCIYNPIEEGPFLPVSRSPSWADTFANKAGAANPDWTYVIFEWDNLFASLMAGLFDKDIAYSNLFVAVRTKTPDGFLPNWSTAGGIRQSGDRTEPPVGAKILLELYRKYEDSWIVEALWEDIVEWNDWFVRERLLQPFGLIGLGSYQEHGAFIGDLENILQAARWESGLDNSPMYDGNEDTLYDKKTHMMQIYDVGMSSLVANEAYCLAELADAIGMHPEKARLLRSRGDRLRDNIWKHLWDPSRNIFANRYRKLLPGTNSSFVRSITPTSFYPLLLPFGNISYSGEDAPTNFDALATVETMVSSWLLNSTRFCLSPNGGFEGNDPNACYWGLPSVSADDPTYMATGHFNYWRGLVWGPMAQIVYWSLQEGSQGLSLQHFQGSLRHTRKTKLTAVSSQRSFSQAIAKARKSLCLQMEALMMSQWKTNRHICENYSPFQNATECSGTLFYHWGALNGLIGTIEEGYYYEVNENSDCS